MSEIKPQAATETQPTPVVKTQALPATLAAYEKMAAEAAARARDDVWKLRNWEPYVKRYDNAGKPIKGLA